VAASTHDLSSRSWAGYDSKRHCLLDALLENVPRLGSPSVQPGLDDQVTLDLSITANRPVSAYGHSARRSPPTGAPLQVSVPHGRSRRNLWRGRRRSGSVESRWLFSLTASTG